jgi:outer membrane immunogenic protein
VKKKNVFSASAVLAMLMATGAAQGADVSPVQINKAPPLIRSSWTGFYAGLGLGFRTTRTDATTTSLIEGTPPDVLSLFAPRQSLDGTGLRGSPYLGFNWQFAPRWVAGIEGDFGLADQTTALEGYNFSPGLGTSGDRLDKLSLKATWDATLRARLGYLLTPATMIYVTGGGAWQRYEITSTCAGNFCVDAEFAPQAITHSTVRSGWTVGTGIEAALWSHWLARVEYRYADYGTASFTNVRSSPFAAFGPFIDEFNVKMRTHTATFGLAYKFGDPIDSGRPDGALGAFAAAPAAVSWTGPYVGLGLGARASRDDLTTKSETVAGTLQDPTTAATSLPFDGTAFRANPYLGFNWQFAARMVAGVEGDFGFAQQTTTRFGYSFSPGYNFIHSSGSDDSLAVKTKWDASLRGRLGVLVTPTTLAFAAGGVAWQRYDVVSSCVSDFPCSPNNFGYTPATIENSKTKTGWTLGGGIETVLWRHWLARAEYRYADFGTASFNIARSSTRPDLDPIVDVFDVKLRTHTVSFGLAYKFN